MTRQALNDLLSELQGRTQEISVLVQRAMGSAVDIVLTGEAAAPIRIGALDRTIRADSAALAERCLEVIAMQQPVATDLRLVMATMSVATDLERIGNHARGIVRLLRRLQRESPESAPAPPLGALAQQVQVFLRDALAALATHDASGARSHLSVDRQIDAAYAAFSREQLRQMAAHPETLGIGMTLLKVAHKLERIGDRVSNIDERTVWIHLGELPTG